MFNCITDYPRLPHYYKISYLKFLYFKYTSGIKLWEMYGPVDHNFLNIFFNFVYAESQNTSI